MNSLFAPSPKLQQQLRLIHILHCRKSETEDTQLSYALRCTLLDIKRFSAFGMVIAFTKARKQHSTLCCENAMYTSITNASAGIPVSLWGM
jgi:hypothetical protein